MKSEGTAGFTLVELLIGVVAAAVLALTAGLMLVNTYQGWARGQGVVELERDAALAIQTLAVATRGACYTNTTPVTGTDTLVVTVPGNTVRTFSVQGRSLIYSHNGGSMIVVSNRLAATKGFVSSYDSAARTITVTLALYDQVTGLGMTVSNMNFRVRN